MSSDSMHQLRDPSKRYWTQKLLNSPTALWLARQSMSSNSMHQLLDSIKGLWFFFFIIIAGSPTALWLARQSMSSDSRAAVGRGEWG